MFDSQRIKFIRKAIGKTQIEFSNDVGIKQSTLSSMESMSVNIGADIVEKVCKTYNVNPSYLLFGTGEMFVPQKEYQQTDMHVIIEAPEVKYQAATMSDVLSVLIKLQAEIAELRKELAALKENNS